MDKRIGTKAGMMFLTH